MQIKLLKYLQGTGDGKTRSEIASYFNITERALSDRVQKFMHPDNHILGTNVQIEVKRRTNLYDSTAHPIFLALNLSEVYSLLSHLIKIDNSLSSSALSADESIKNIIIDIISQLTGYAKNILRQAELDVDAYKTDEPRKFRNETEENEYYKNMKIKHIYRMWIKGNKDFLEGSLQVNTGTGKEFIFYPSDNKMPIQLDWDEIDLILSDQHQI